MVEEATHNAWRWCWVHRRGRERVLLLMLIASSLRADAPAESGPESGESGPEIVVDMPAHGVTELRPWQFVHGRILHRPSDPPIYLSTTLWGSPSGRAIALQVPALFSKHTAIRQTAQSLTKPLGWSCHEANRVTNDFPLFCTLHVSYSAVKEPTLALTCPKSIALWFADSVHQSA